MEGRILCPIDFSESSIDALKCALEMAKQERLGVIVLYSYRLIQTGQNEEILEFKNKTEAAAKEKFSAVEHLFQNGVVTDHEFIVEIGFFSDCIARQIRTKPITKIVIDNKMRPLLNDSHLNLEPFLRSLPVPVVVVGGNG